MGRDAEKRNLPSSLGEPWSEALVKVSVMSLLRGSMRDKAKTIVRVLVRDIIRVFVS